MSNALNAYGNVHHRPVLSDSAEKGNLGKNFVSIKRKEDILNP